MTIQPPLLAEPSSRRSVAVNGQAASNGQEPRATDRWETEVVIVCGADRADLRHRTAALAEAVTTHPEVALKDLAFSLNTDLPAGGSRLAVVAGSMEELRSRLAAAADRLADPNCRQVRDSQGLYFFEKPLYLEGRLALLFPGEGAQYVNMLADLLPHFPEIKEHFAVCDRLLVSGGHRDTPLTDVILLPPDATPEQEAAAEREMWRLSTGSFSVLAAEWALYLLLLRLGLKPDAYAGHSSGELSALAASGGVPPTEESFAQMFSVSQGLQRQEDADHLADAILLAVAAGRKAIAAIIEQAGPDVFLAMDNCPHQTVLCGPPALMESVEEQLKARGIVCERLPFHRPYHTPLFEPQLGPVARTYQNVGVQLPHTTVYSCATGRRFPPDAREIERLAVAQWARAVQFSTLIESMYADGVRIFLEAGPRGTLTSFVEDILRGRSFAAVPSNVQRRSGLTQLNHMAGLLLAHHVPIRLDHFYSRRNPRRVEWDRETGRQGDKETGRQGDKETIRVAVASGSEVPAGPRLSSPACGEPSGRGTVLNQYWNVMEQFLDLQREVLEQFLATRRGPATEGTEPSPDARAVEVNGRAGGVSPRLYPIQPGADAPHSPAAWPLLGEIIQHEPGRSLLLRRRMDLHEDLYALDHTLGGRNASALDPDLNGLPVMPMALSMEMMAEAAATLVPGKLLIGMERVRLQRWIPLDEEESIVLELRAEVQPGDPAAVAITIRDLGNSVRPGNPEAAVVEGTVLLGDHYAEPPAIDEFPLSNQRGCPYTPPQLYAEERRMFHGPIFQAVCSTDRQGDEGIEGHLRTLPHSGMFRSTSRPELLTDPLLIDASTHLLGSWHLMQPDQNGRVVFPYELGSVQIYGPRPALGSRVKCRVAVGATSARRVSHRIDLIGEDGRLWCRLGPAEYWRFYVPQCFVDFYRRHDEFLLTEVCPACPAEPAVSCRRVQPVPDILQLVWRNALAHVALSRSEWAEFVALKWPEPRKNDWLFGRIAAKDAVRILWRERHGVRLFPADIEIDHDAHGRPVALLRGAAAAEELPAISITHCGGVMAALAAFGRTVGIDLERIAPRAPGFEEIAFDDSEHRLLDQFGDRRDEGITRFWCAKEAVAKALGRGLAEGPRSVAVRGVDLQTGTVQVALGPLLAEAYPQWRLELLRARTVREGEWIVATTFCERVTP